MLQTMNITSITNSTANGRVAHTLSTLMRRITLLVTLLITFALGARAAQYVFYYEATGDTKYYMANVNNALTAVTTYNANTCVWEGESGGVFSNNGRYINLNRNDGSISLANNDDVYDLTISNEGYVYYRRQNGTNYYIYYTDNGFSNSSSSNTYGSTRVKAEEVVVQYVFYYNGYYLAINDNGTDIEPVAEFDPETCIWSGPETGTGVYSATVNGETYYLILQYSYSQRRYILSITDNQDEATQWTINGAKLYRNGRYVRYNNNSWTTTDSNWGSGTDVLYPITQIINGTPIVEYAVGKANVSPETKTLDYLGMQEFTAQATVTKTTRTETYRHNSSQEGIITIYDETSETLPPTGYDWSLSSTDNLTLGSGTENTNTVTYTTPSNTNKSVELTATAYYMDGENRIEGELATATISVIEKLEDPTTITAQNLTVEVGKTGTIAYQLQPDGAYQDITYTVADDDVATVDANGMVTGVKAGTTTVILTAKKINGDTSLDLTTTITVTVMDRCATPVITIDRSTGSTTIACSTVGATIYYTTDGSDPTVNSDLLYEEAFNVDYGVIVKAIAVKDGWLDSDIGSASSGGTGESASDPYYVASVEGLNYMVSHPSYHFKVVDDFNALGFSGSVTGFSGTFDGDYKVISGLTQPLFTSTNGATIKNVVLDDVSLTSSVTVSGTTCLGAIAAYAAGSTKIYNCGILSKEGTSSVSGGDHTGSLVGYITDNTRVVNNYSYANVSGGAYVGGIVGRVAGTALSNSNYSNNSHCAVTNNMFYGDLSGTSNVSPVYGGNHTSNIQNTNEYNFWRSKAKVSYNNYNNQLAIDKDAYLNRFPFYRHIQNTHRELAAIYLFGARTDDNVAEIGHWYNVKNDEKVPYPIIEEWKTNTKRTTVDIAANLPNTSEKFAGKLLNNISADGYYTGTGQQVTSMGSGGYLRVNVSINGSSYSSELPITDMDTLNYDFTWGKVVLPFANEYEGWTRDYSKICTGWKITGITGGTTGSLTNYNFADRDCTAKDLYSNSNYIFAQGGNYIVPYGVTAITIEANFANAYYLSDAYYDYGYDASYDNQRGLITDVPTTYHEQTVYTNLNELIEDMPTSTNPHSQAIVLVGNFHYNQEEIGDCFETGKALTIMSVDEDCNQEPDYGWYSYHTNNRTDIPPMRFDFVPNIGIGMAARTTESTPYPTIGIWHAHGWFELTETCVSMMSECEINSYSFADNDNEKGNNRWIANSGYFIQIVRARDGNCKKLSYIQIGGNAYVEQLYPGSHTDNARQVTIRPINVTGGEIEECFMTGYKAGATAEGDNIYFWCGGGKIHKYLSAYMENPSTNGVNVTAKVDHARIGRFFGGGTSSSAPITGNINITMNNSLVDFYCGGPEFGDMKPGKTVTTNAIGSTFGQYYGAGFGGTSITYNRERQNAGVNFGNTPVTYPLDWSNYKRLTYNPDYGIGSCYDFEFILYSGGGGTGVARFYTGYAQFSLAQTGNVENTLQNCTVTGDFYGGGCQGTVAGTVKSKLTGCTLLGNAFGGGYKAAANKVEVYPTTQPTYSVYTKETGIFSDFGIEAPEIYTWQYNTSIGSDEGKKFLYTTTDMSQLGNVTGAITLDIKGGTVAQSVFGGGNESPSRDNTSVTIDGNAVVGTNVFGGGNIADVDGNTQVSLKSGNINKNVYGAGAGNLLSATAGQVKKNVTVDITGGTIGGNVYGGGAIANSNVEASANSSAYTTKVNLTGGLIKGDAYGGGEGTMDYDKDDSEQKANAAALVYGDVTVVLDGTRFELKTIKDDNEIEIPASGRIFGCNNINGSPKGTVLVRVQKTVGPTNEKPAKGSGIYELQAVYGGGNLAAYNPAEPMADGQFTSYTYGGNSVAHDNTDKPVQVVIDGCGETSIEYVYGGGNAAPTPATDAIIIGSYEIGSVFGGGNGKDKYTLDGGETWLANNGADVGVIDAAAYANDKTTGIYGTGEAKASVLGGTVHNVFGGSNTKGNVVGEATAYLDQASDCPLVVDGVYGGGNEAYMEGDAKIELGCIESLKEIYGGARNADVDGDINLTLTSGHFDRVFGGNNIGGQINGSITVNIEETGCNPITIGELYGCGNQAAYTTPEGKNHPTINIRSFTSIGNVFGGGLGAGAVVKGNPTVNINVVKGDKNDAVEGWTYNGSTIDFGNEYTVTLPRHEKGKIGAIGTVFGGGNAAEVIGNTSVNVGTETDVTFVSLTGTETERTKKVEGADIRGNVYGGGNQADVTGKTNVVIGQQD